jgi:perosamine synthetase
MLTRSRPYVNTDKFVENVASIEEQTEETIVQFQNQFSNFLGGGHCIATHQSRAGLLFALRSIPDIHGREVIVQSFTYRGVIQAILEAGAIPVLVDCSLDDLSATPEMIENSITEDTKAIIATHLFGIPCDVGEMANIARERECVLIEDCAQCLGGLHRGRPVGTYGDFSTFSFNFEKHMSTGEGGMLVVNNNAYLDDINRLVAESRRVSPLREKMHVYGLLVLYLCTNRDAYETYLDAYFGQNLVKEQPKLLRLIEAHLNDGESAEDIENEILHFVREKKILQKKKQKKSLLIENLTALMNLIRSNNGGIDDGYLLMNSLRACIGSLHLKDLLKVNRVRNTNAKMFADMMENCDLFSLPQVSPHSEAAFLKFNLLNRSKMPIKDISASAWKKGYEVGNFQWSKPYHKIFLMNKKVTYHREGLQNSEFIAGNILNLPIHCSLTENDIHDIVDLLKQFEQ